MKMTTFQKLLSKMNKKIIIVGTLIIFLLTLFYWFQIRPSQIKASCQIEADEWYQKARDFNDEDKDGSIPFSTFEDIQQGMKNKYSFCLHRNGL